MIRTPISSTISAAAVVVLMTSCGTTPHNPGQSTSVKQSSISQVDLRKAAIAADPQACTSPNADPRTVKLPRVAANTRAAFLLNPPQNTAALSKQQLDKLLGQPNLSGMELAGSTILAVLENAPARFENEKTLRSELGASIPEPGFRQMRNRTIVKFVLKSPMQWEYKRTRYTASYTAGTGIGVFRQVGPIEDVIPGKVNDDQEALWESRQIVMHWGEGRWEVLCFSIVGPMIDFDTTGDSMPVSSSNYAALDTWKKYDLETSSSSVRSGQ